MVGSRRLVIIGVIVGALVLVAVIATLFSGGGRSSYRGTCEDVLQLVIDKKYDESYTLLSSGITASDSKDSWRSKMIGLANVYYNGEPTFIEETPVQNYEGDPAEVKRALLRFELKNPVATSDISCYIRDDGNGTVQVDGFISNVREAE